MSDQAAQILQTFKHFVEVTSVGQKLSEADLKSIKDKGLNKMLKECCGDVVAKAAEAQVFPKYMDKKTKKLDLSVFTGDFLTELAAVVEQNKKKLPKRPEFTDPAVVAQLEQIKKQIAEKHSLSTKEQKVDAVTARLTDTKGYTGSHKERFDESGKGKGMAGTSDQASNSGYVQGYKNENTYKK